MKCQGYGLFPGGDPRTFAPDPDRSSKGQRQSHRNACAAWSRGDRVEVGHGSFGLGSYSYDPGDEPCGAEHPFTTQVCELDGGHEGHHSADDGRTTWVLKGEPGWADWLTGAPAGASHG